MPPDTIRDLREGDDARRRAAAEWLGQHPDRAAFDALLAALDDPNPDVILLAFRALARLGNPAALEPMRLAFVRYNEVHFSAHNRIGLLCPSSALELLMRSADPAGQIRELVA